MLVDIISGDGYDNMLFCPHAYGLCVCTADGMEAMETTSAPDPSSSIPYIPSKSSGYSGSKTEGMDLENGCDALSQQFTIATHFVKVKRSGTLTDVTTLWDLVGTEAVSGSLDSVLDSRPGFDRLPSINAFDKVCVCRCGM